MARASGKFDARFTHMWLGNAFFQKTTVYGSDAMAGVIIHELSHAIVGTDDHPHPDTGQECYGHDLCKHIAQNYANIAIDNELDVVMDRCLKIEHARFHGGLHLAGFDTGVIDSRLTS